MRPYATLDPKFDASETDAGGNKHFARASAVGNLAGKGGDVHPTVRNSENKRRARTHFNKRARQVLKRDLNSRIAE